MPDTHSSVVGGSSASRIINCQGSPALLAQVPQVVNRDTSYSIEGTALHTAIEQLITGELCLEDFPRAIMTRSGPAMITQALVHDFLVPALAYWNELLPVVDEWMLEVQVKFPGIEGAFGTADVLARDEQKNRTYLTDWKGGAGVGVLAVRPDPDDPDYELINEQLMFYACAARHTHPELFPKGCSVVLTIVQPRARDQAPITTVDVTLDDLDAFEAELQEAVALSRTPEAPTKKGDWCKFQPCQTICPHHTGPLIDLNTLGEKVPSVLKPEAPNYKFMLLDVLNAAPAVEALIREARNQAHILLGNGEQLEGWKLVQKRGTRQWAVSEDKLPKLLKVKKADLYETALKSPAQVEKILPKGVKLPEGAATTVSSGTTIAPIKDKRPAVTGGDITKIMQEILDED